MNITGQTRSEPSRLLRWILVFGLILTGASKLPPLDGELVMPVWLLKSLAGLELAAGIALAASWWVRGLSLFVMLLCAVGAFLQLSLSGSCGCSGILQLSPAVHLSFISVLGLAAAWLYSSQAGGSADTRATAGLSRTGGS